MLICITHEYVVGYWLPIHIIHKCTCMYVCSHLQQEVILNLPVKITRFFSTNNCFTKNRNGISSTRDSRPIYNEKLQCSYIRYA